MSDYQIPEDITWRDINAWLSDTVFLATILDGKSAPRQLPCWLDVHRWSEEMGYASVYDAEGNYHSRVPYKNISLEWPRLGAINLGNKAVYIERLPTRQWRRAFNVDGITIREPPVTDPKSIIYPRQLLRQPFVMNVFYPHYYSTINEALELLENGKIQSCAISRQIILRGPKIVNSKRFMHVYYRGYYVGKLEPTTYTYRAAINKEHYTPKILKKLGGNFVCL